MAPDGTIAMAVLVLALATAGTAISHLLEAGPTAEENATHPRAPLLFSRQPYDFEPYGTTTLTAGRRGVGSALAGPGLREAAVFLCAPLLAASFRAGVADSAGWAARKLAVAVTRTGPVPRHVGFVMDGNRRWAKQQGLQTLEGHHLGYRAMVKLLEHCKDLGVEVVTVYAFSIENFKRSKQEVDYLMELAMSKFEEAVGRRGELYQHRVRVRVRGDLSLLSRPVRRAIARVVAATAENDGPLLNVCLSYTSREELASTAHALAAGVKKGELEAADITGDLIERSLYTEDAPAPELLVRTSGETRLSDFLLWQCAMSQLSFTEVLWPDFSWWYLLPILLDYQLAFNSLDRLRKRERQRLRAWDRARDLARLRGVPAPAPAAHTLPDVTGAFLVAAPATGDALPSAPLAESAEETAQLDALAEARGLRQARFVARLSARRLAAELGEGVPATEDR